MQDNADQCLNSTSAGYMRLNLLEDELQKSVGSNSSSSAQLGPSFVASCPVLRDNEAEVIRYLTDSNTCSFIEFDTAFNEFVACRGSALQARNNRLDLLAFASDQRYGWNAVVIEPESDS